MSGDTIGLRAEALAGKPLLECMMRVARGWLDRSL